MDLDAMSSVVSVFRTIGGDGQGDPCPSISACGSDTVIAAFVRSFGLLRDQELNVRASWAALATTGDQAIELMRQADAAAAGVNG